MAVLSAARPARLAAIASWVILVGLATLSLAGCGDGGLTCDEGDAIARVRALPQPTWAALYEEAEAWSRTDRARRRSRPVATPLPGVAADGRLEMRFFTRDTARVTLSHCFDHGIALQLEGLDTPQGRVVLVWGEGPTAGDQVLWSRGPAAIP